jgi:hypothetical protein
MPSHKANLIGVFSRTKGDMELIQNMPLKDVNRLYKARKAKRGDSLPRDLFGNEYQLVAGEADSIIQELTSLAR